MSTVRLQNEAFFQWCITFNPRSQTLPTLQYNGSLMKKIDYTDFDVVPMRETARLAFIACTCSSLLVNLH